MREALADHPEIYWTGYVQDAQKEFAEASLVLALVQGDAPRGPMISTSSTLPTSTGWVKPPVNCAGTS